MSNQPKITVITASYNYENYIAETIESIINQKYQNWELIIADDGSKDNSIKVIQEYCNKDNRIKLVTHKNNANKGLPETVKLALSHATGEYTAFLESDDIWHEDNLQEKVQALEKYPNADFIFNGVNILEVLKPKKHNNILVDKMIKNSGKKLEFYTIGS